MNHEPQPVPTPFQFLKSADTTMLNHTREISIIFCDKWIIESSGHVQACNMMCYSYEMKNDVIAYGLHPWTFGVVGSARSYIIGQFNLLNHSGLPKEKFVPLGVLECTKARYWMAGEHGDFSSFDTVTHLLYPSSEGGEMERQTHVFMT